MSIDSHEIVDGQGAFDLAKWRTYVSNAILEVQPEATVICPFGFEITGESSYLMRNLRRFYVYVCVPEYLAESADTVAEAGCRNLLKSLKQLAPSFFASIGPVSHPNGRSLLNDDGTRLLHFNVMAHRDPMLEVYARYILACPNAILDRYLREAREFDFDHAARRYLFQIAIILASLYSEIPDVRSMDLSALTRQVAGLASRPVSTEQFEPATTTEAMLLTNVVVPMASKIREYATASRHPENTVRFEVPDIHGGRRLIGQMHRSMLDDKVSLICTKYESYPTRVAEN